MASIPRVLPTSVTIKGKHISFHWQLIPLPGVEIPLVIPVKTQSTIVCLDVPHVITVL
jgi:hypothetical protein